MRNAEKEIADCGLRSADWEEVFSENRLLVDG